eukprot:361465-Pyramimonas_sp.AAC.1
MSLENGNGKKRQPETANKRFQDWSRSQNRSKDGERCGKKTASEPATERQNGTGHKNGPVVSRAC